MKPFLAIAFVAACAIAQTGDRNLTDTPHEGADKSYAVNATGKAEKAGDDRMLLRQSSEGSESVAVFPTGRSIRSNYAKDSMPQKSAPPRLVRLDAEGWTFLIVSGAVTGLDYYSTHKIIDMGGYEKNQVIADGRGVNYGKAGAIDAANFTSQFVYQGIVKHHIPERYKWVGDWIVRPAISIGIAYRARAVVNNFSLISSHGGAR